jgi:hypothetical protein
MNAGLNAGIGMTIELPAMVYDRLMKAAEFAGLTPAEWIERRLPPLPPPVRYNEDGSRMTMAQALAGRIGVVDSGGSEHLAERHSEVFGEILEEKRRAGRL